MAKCDACEKIETSTRGAPGHDALVEGGTTKENWGQGAVFTTKYRCSICGTRWEYENDKKDSGAGWSVDR